MLKNLAALAALTLLANPGTSFAVTCAQDNVPAATLLVPYFRVGGAGVTGSGSSLQNIPDDSGTDTLVAVTNIASQSIIIHVTVWNKYSVPVLQFNVPMTGHDVVFWGMRSVLNGHLNVNYDPVTRKGAQHLTKGFDPCGQDTTKPIPLNAAVKTAFTRFAPAASDSDATLAISVYKDPAFDGAFRQRIWTSLDESYDISNWSGFSTYVPGAGVVDADNYACTGEAGTTVSGDFSGYLTIDVANYCTQRFPNEAAYWENDAIATVGWGGHPGANVLMGDIFYVDGTAGTVAGGRFGNVSGEPTVQIEFDSRLLWVANGTYPGINTGSKTFYGRYHVDDSGVGSAYAFSGDGREPLGNVYGFRYMQSAPPTVYGTWINVWRSDWYPNDTNPVSNDPTVDLCGWWGGMLGLAGYFGDGFMDTGVHRIGVEVFDNDGQLFVLRGGPSSGPDYGPLFIFLETQRLVVTPNSVVVPTSYYGGWIRLSLPGWMTEQAYVGVQHSGLGLAMSVGQSATLLTGEGVCVPQQTTQIPALKPTGVVETNQPVQTGLRY